MRRISLIAVFLAINFFNLTQASACEPDEKNNLIVCNDPHCTLRKQSLSQTPQDTFLSILEFLDEKSALKVKRLSKQTLQNEQKGNPNTLERRVHLEDLKAEYATCFSHLQALYLHTKNADFVADTSLVHFMEAEKNLKNLAIVGINFNQISVLTRHCLPGIKTLYLSHFDGSEDDLKLILKSFPQLEEMTLLLFEKSTIDLRNVPQLKKLKLYKGFSITDSSSPQVEEKAETLTKLTEFILPDLLLLSEFETLSEAQQSRIRETLRTLNCAPHLRTVLPPLEKYLFQWCTTESESHKILALGFLLKDFNQFSLESTEGNMNALLTHLPLDLKKDWARALWNVILIANLRWKEAIQNAVDLRQQGKEEALHWLFEALRSYAEAVNPAAVNDHFESLIEELKQKNENLISATQEAEWRAKWMESIALYSPRFAHLDPLDDKFIDTEDETDQLRDALAFNPYSHHPEEAVAGAITAALPPALKALREERKAYFFSMALQNAEQTSRMGPSLKQSGRWTEEWTGTLRALMLDPDHSDKKKMLISRLAESYKSALESGKSPHQASDVFAFLFTFFFFDKVDPKNAQYWAKRFIDCPLSSLYPDLKFFKFYLFNQNYEIQLCLTDDPIYLKRLTELMEPIIVSDFSRFGLIHACTPQQKEWYQKLIHQLKSIYLKRSGNEMQAEEAVFRLTHDGKKLEWSLIFTNTLSDLLEEQEPDEYGKAQITALGNLLKACLDAKTIVQKTAHLFPRMIRFYLDRNDQTEALFWMKQLIDSYEQNIPRPPYDFIRDDQLLRYAILIRVAEDPDYGPRYFNLIRPIMPLLTLSQPALHFVNPQVAIPHTSRLRRFLGAFFSLDSH